MTKLLVIEASPQLETSISRSVTNQFILEWCRIFPNGDVRKRDLVLTEMPFINTDWIGGAFTPADIHSPETAAAMQLSNTLIEELQWADHIVIGTPMHNLTIPASLKAYIDQVVRVGLTVSSNNEGLLKNKKAATIIASGGDFSPGSPTENFNLATPYLRHVFGFIGITDLQVLLAGPTRPILVGERTLDDLKFSLEPKIIEIVGSWNT